jgi:hypothetical protein
MAKALLKIKGVKALYDGIVSNIWAAAAHVEGHITTQMGKFMGTLSESITELSTAIANEFDDIRAAAEATLQELRDQLEAVGSENVELKEALEQQVATSEGYLQQITDAQQRIDALVAQLQENDPVVGGGGDEHPDNTLPGDLPHPDNSLPGEQPYPDNTLPGEEPHPDNTLPEPGDQPVVDHRSGRGRRSGK